MTEEVFKLIKEQSKIPSISSHENINKLSIVNNLMKNLSSEGNVTKIFELYNKLNQLEIKLNHETYFYLLMVRRFLLYWTFIFEIISFIINIVLLA